MRLTITEMDEIVSAAMVQALRERRPLFGRRYVWLPAGTIPLGGRVWHHRVTLDGRWGYTLRQARQMHQALQPLLEIYASQLEAAIKMIYMDIH